MRKSVIRYAPKGNNRFATVKLQRKEVCVVCLILLVDSSLTCSPKPPTTQDLLDASRQGDFRLVRHYLGTGVDVNGKDSLGQTSLQVAAFKGYKKTADVLIDYGANVNTSSYDGGTALMAAATEGHYDIAKMLLENGAFIEAKSNGGWTSLIHASRYNHPKVVTLLLDNGADIDAVNYNGETSLIIATWGGNLDVVKILLARGADVNAKDTYGDGFTALDLAIEKNHTNIAELLKEKDAKRGSESVSSSNTE